MASAQRIASTLYRRARTLRVRFARPRPWRGVRILGYHRVAAAPRAPLAVSPRGFREQMEAVTCSGHEPISLARAVELLRSPVDGCYVCVTFDDGYRDNLEHAE